MYGLGYRPTDRDIKLLSLKQIYEAARAQRETAWMNAQAIASAVWGGGPPWEAEPGPSDEERAAARRAEAEEIVERHRATHERLWRQQVGQA